MAANSVLSTISQEFESLSARPVHVAGESFGCEGSFTLSEIRDLLLARSTPGSMRDLIWRGIVCSARSEGGSWTTIALGMAMPGLKNLAKQFARDYAETNHEDVCSEIVTGFLEALRTVDVERSAILTRMYWATYRAVRRSAYAEVFASKAVAAAAVAATVTTIATAVHEGVARPESHPDLVLVRLVEEQVLTASEADLISAVRLDRRSLGDVAEVLGISANAALLRLRRAEMRVAARLTDTAAPSRRVFKQDRKREARAVPDSSGPAIRTSFVEEPLGVLAAGGGSAEGRAR